MKETNETCEIAEISDEDIKAAFKELKAYVDISLDDFKEIYLHALKHAKDRLHNVPVDAVMARSIISVSEYAGIDDAIRLFSENKITCLPVVDNENRIAGIVTRKDIIAASGLAKNHTLKDIVKHLIGVPAPRRPDVSDKAVKDIMSSPAIVIYSGSGLKEAANKLVEKGINNLPVVDKDDKLLGIISTGDIVRNTGGVRP